MLSCTDPQTPVRHDSPKEAAELRDGCTDKDICPVPRTSHNGKQGSSVKELEKPFAI